MGLRRDRPEARAACRRVRSGVGGYTCSVHGRSWPCKIPDDPSEQLALLEQATPLGAGVLAEIAAERRRQLDRFGTSYDVQHTAEDWARILAEYANRALHDGNRIRAEDPHAVPAAMVEAYRLRLVQVAAVAAAAVEALDHVKETR